MFSFQIKKDKNYKKILHKIMVEALEITEAQEALVLYGTNHSLNLHLPHKEWDRSAVYGIYGKRLFSLPAKLKIKLAEKRKLLPVKNQINKNNQTVENYGMIPYLLNRNINFYREGITVLMAPGTGKYLSQNCKPFLKIPLLTYNRSFISPLSDNVYISKELMEIRKSRNLLSLTIPHFGILELNNIHPKYFENTNEALLKTTLNRLIDFIDTSSMEYFKQKSKNITEHQRIKELVEKESLLRQAGRNFHSKELELQQTTEALDQATQEKQRLQKQSLRLSGEIYSAQKAIEEMKLENNSGLGAIAHTTKNLYMTQQAYSNMAGDHQEDSEKIIKKMNNVIHRVNKQFKNLNQYTFWKQITKLSALLNKKQQDFIASLEIEKNHNARIMEYILAVLAYQRGRDHPTEGSYYSSLTKVLKHIEFSHYNRLKQLGITFKYQNHTQDMPIRLNRIHHFHLQEDIFINLIMNSIKALQNQSNKQILIDTYLKVNENQDEYYEIHYRDNGIGIPFDKKEEIFHGWSGNNGDYLKNSLENKTERGIGGKTILKRVTQAGGSISEVGIPGEGAHFILCFDKYTEEEQSVLNGPESIMKSESPHSTEELTHLTTQKTRILVVDDDNMIFSHISKIFDGVFSATHAIGFEETWDKILSSEPPDLITLDLDLKAAERGEKLLMELKSRGYAEKIPIIVISGSDRAYDEVNLLNLGAWEVIKKPVRDKELKESVYQALNKKWELIRG